MKTIVLALGTLAFAGAAFAQEATDSPAKPAITTPNSTNPSAPVKGKNSFIESQAKMQIAKSGFSNVTNLKLGEDGIWRASAERNGVPVSVALDYQGNVTEGAL